MLAFFVLPESRTPTREKIDLAALNPLRPLRWVFSMKSLLPIILIFFIFSATGEVYGTCWALWGNDTFGWNGLWIEAAANYVVEIQNHLGPFLAHGKLRLSQNLITAENINAVFAQAGMSGEIDLLSIDIDYNDYWVWKALTVVNPRVVVIEYNATLRPPMSLVVPYDPTRMWDGSNYFGASLEALVRLGREKGYRIVGCNYAGANAFFVRDDVAGDRFLDPATSEEHYEPPRYFYALQMAGHRARPGPYVSV